MPSTDGDGVGDLREVDCDSVKVASPVNVAVRDPTEPVTVTVFDTDTVRDPVGGFDSVSVRDCVRSEENERVNVGVYDTLSTVRDGPSDGVG